MWSCPKCKENNADHVDTCRYCDTKRVGASPTTPPPEVSPATSPGGGGSAFVKGGCGCLVVFVVLAFIAVLLGGHAHANVGGLIFLFIIGGGIGLIIFAVYKKGRKDASGNEHPQKPDDHDV
jgi:hypothetical protein